MPETSGKNIRKVLAVIVDYNDHASAEAFSLQLAGLQTAGYALTVAHVDNGSLVPHIYSAAQLAAGVVAIRLPENYGYAGGLNEAIARFDSSYDAYWFLNSDFWIEPDALDQLVAALDREPRVGAVGPRVLKGDSLKVWGARGSVSPFWGVTAMSDWPQGGVLPRWSYLPGCSILVRASLYREVGGVSTRYRLYFEETEFCIRLQRLGYDLWVEKSAIAHHRVASIEAGVPARPFAFYFARNNLYFWKHCFGIPIWLQLPRTLFVILKELVLPLRRARSGAEFRDRLAYVWFGFLDGFEFSRRRFTKHERRLFLPPGAGE